MKIQTYKQLVEVIETPDGKGVKVLTDKIPGTEENEDLDIPDNKDLVTFITEKAKDLKEAEDEAIQIKLHFAQIGDTIKLTRKKLV